MDPSTGMTIESNIIGASHQGAILIYNDCHVANNTFVLRQTARLSALLYLGLLDRGTTPGSHGNTLVKNIFVFRGNTSSVFAFAHGPGRWTGFNQSLIASSGSNIYWNGDQRRKWSGPSFRAGLGCDPLDPSCKNTTGHDLKSRLADPLFFDSANSDYHGTRRRGWSAGREGGRVVEASRVGRAKQGERWV